MLGLILPFLFFYFSVIVQTEVVVKKSNFEDGVDDWTVENSSWKRLPLATLKQDHPTDLPNPPGLLSTMVMVPGNKSFNGSHLGYAVMYKDLLVPDMTELEVFFTCIVLGWRDDNDPSVRMDNPILQIMYDEVLVFHLESAITNNSGHYSNGNWNQFRLYSSYKSNFTMRITVMGSPGGNPTNLVALDNIIIKMSTNSSKNVSDSEQQEPQADWEDKNGTWEKLETDSEEDERESEGNGALAKRPEFCDLLPEKGPCKAVLPRFHYDLVTQDCERFIYGGCDGNENNFHTRLACQAICKKPNKTEDDMIFAVFFGGQPTFQRPNNNIRLPNNNNIHQDTTNLTLTFDQGFLDWNVEHWMIFTYDSLLAKTSNVSALNESSKSGAYPAYHQDNLSRSRPRLMHPIRLSNGCNITVTLSLKLVGNLSPILHPFFDSINPGFKFYIGDYLLFDYLLSGELDEKWHTYTMVRETESILTFPHLTNGGGPYQIIRVEAWQGSGGRGYVVLDDLKILQTSNNNKSETNKNENGATTTEETAAKTTTTESDKLLVFPCFLPSSSGPCTDNLKRYYFDKTTSTCKQFIFGGCKGNANNFLTLTACNSKCNDDDDDDDNRQTDICTLLRNQGSCRGFVERYYFNSRTKKCVSFIYHGCGGNGNNFATKQACLAVCSNNNSSNDNTTRLAENSIEFVTAFPRTKSDCSLPIVEGPCQAHIQMWAFDTEVGKCTNFTYGGCGGNANRFFTRGECADTCSSSTTPKTTTAKIFPKKTKSSKLLVKSKSVCNRPRVGLSITCGKGVNLSKYFYYDKPTNSCLAEIGCPVPKADTAKGNRFISQLTCQKLCQHSSSTSAYKSQLVDPLVCLLSPERGPCQNNTRKRYFYDPEQSKCLSFVYGGCEGNSNNFNTLSTCYKHCKKAETLVPVNVSLAACDLPRDNGSCNSKIQRYFFDSSRHECRPFLYGGCKGNQNRFVSKEDCIELCINNGSNSSVVVEAIVGILLVLFMGLGGFCGYRYCQARKAGETYRLFSGQQRERGNSMSSTAGTIDNMAAMAYENPAYGGQPDPGRNSFQLNGMAHRNQNNVETI